MRTPGRRTSLTEEEEKGERRREAGDAYHLPLARFFLLSLSFLLLNTPFSLQHANSSLSVSHSLSHSLSLFFLFALLCSRSLATTVSFFLYRSLWLSLSLSLFFSALSFGSRGGKACIIRRNSTGITLVWIPSSHPASAFLCRATNLFNHSTVDRQAAPLLACGP